MKRAMVITLVVGIVAGLALAPAYAGKKKAPKKIERVIEIAYQCPCGPSWGRSTPAGTGIGFWLSGGAIGGGFAATGPDDKFVSVEVLDGSGQAVKVSLAQNVDGTDNLAEVPIGEVCGSIAEPLAVPNPGIQVDLFVFEGFCDDGTTPSIATSGTIKLTFSNVP